MLSNDGGTAIASEQAIDVVVLDIDMPRPDEWQTLDALRFENPDQRVVVISGSAAQDRARQQGTGFLRKPFSGQALARAVGEALA